MISNSAANTPRSSAKSPVNWIGETAASFRTMTPDGPALRASDAIFKGRKVVLFGVPGAFTPTCHKNHLPGFLSQAEAFKAIGVDEIAVVSVNDVHVMGAWAKATSGEDKISYLADGNGEFTRAIGLEFDAAAGGMGQRSKRFSMLVEDGVVKRLNIEDAPSKADASSAAALLAQL